MNWALKTDDFAVLDEVFSAQDLESIQAYVVERAPLEYINRVSLERVFSHADGSPLHSPSVVVEPEETADGLRPLRDAPVLDGPNRYSYPSDCPVDKVIDWILGHAAELEPWLGRAVEHWKTLSAGAWVYPQGTGLDWHADDGHYTGAFAFYCHPTWKSRWSGEFMVAHRPFEPPRWSESGTFVVPRSNRMVILRGGTPHKINRVSPLAGENLRCSISGFFDVRTIAALLEGVAQSD